MGISSRQRSKTRSMLAALTLGPLVALGLGACSRSGLEGLGVASGNPAGSDEVSGEVDAGSSSASSPDATTFVDATAAPTATSTTPKPPKPPPTTTAEPPPPPGPTTPGCTPVDETCNGEDDDCDGDVDEELASIPCPGGGDRYCVAGRYSACPQRCETCVPGSERVCFLSYCTYWATQTCAADGRSFGTCREFHVPPECEAVSEKHKDSPALEQCCVDHGYCCRDEFDLDGDGSRNDMVGACDEVACGS